MLKPPGPAEVHQACERQLLWPWLSILSCYRDFRDASSPVQCYVLNSVGDYDYQSTESLHGCTVIAREGPALLVVARQLLQGSGLACGRSAAAVIFTQLVTGTDATGRLLLHRGRWLFKIGHNDAAVGMKIPESQSGPVRGIRLPE